MTAGSCRSRSQFVSRPYLTGDVTVVTFGGYVGEEMDHSAFAGGTMEDWYSVWSGLTLSSLALTAVVDPNAAAVPAFMPMPGASGGRYSYESVTYLDILGGSNCDPDGCSLWRQYYNMPAQYNLPVWHANGEWMAKPRRLADQKPDWSDALVNRTKSAWASLMDVWSRTSAKPQSTLQCAACPPGCKPTAARSSERRRLLFASLPHETSCECP